MINKFDKLAIWSVVLVYSLSLMYLYVPFDYSTRPPLFLTIILYIISIGYFVFVYPILNLFIKEIVKEKKE